MSPRRVESITGLRSPVPTLLRSNLEPTEIEKASILDAIRSCETKLFAISHVRDYPTIEARDYYMRFLTSHRAILSVIRRIPNELLDTIFTTVAEINGGQPWTLGLVCRRWWIVALSSIPQIRPGGEYAIISWKKSVSSSMMNPYMSRLPKQISISIHNVDPTLGAKPYRAEASHSSLSLASNRWVLLSLDLGNTNFTTLSQTIRNNLPLLRSLKIKLNSKLEGGLGGFLNAFENAPQLREIEVEAHSSHFLVVPWGQITRYVERCQMSVALTRLIRDDSILEDLTYIVSSTTIHFPTATLKHLKYLDIRAPDAGLYYTLRLPALKCVRLQLDTGDAIEKLIHLIQQSSCNLTKISIHARFMEESSLFTLLQLTPQLRELECNDLPISDLLQLTFFPNILPIAPLLKKLVLHSSSRAFYPELMAMIESRAKFGERYTRKLPPNSVERLDVQMVFPSSGECVETHSLLEGWEQPSTAKFLKVKNMAAQLQSTLDVWRRPQLRSGIIQSVLDVKKSYVLHSILTCIEVERILDVMFLNVCVPFCFTFQTGSYIRRRQESTRRSMK
jgi:hypothetical protein